MKAKKPKPIYGLPCNLYRHLSKALLAKYDLEAKGWRAKTLRSNQFAYHMGTLGYCDLKRKIIWLNFDALKKRSFAFVRGTIVHEIAHAITGHGHDEVWLAKCHELGIKGRVIAPHIKRKK